MEFFVTQGTEEWRALRYKYLTATDVGKLLAGSEKDFERIRSIKARETEEVVSASLQALFHWGTENETTAAQAFLDALAVPAQAYFTGMHVHSNHWLAASIDRLVLLPLGGALRVVDVELKCTHKPPSAPRPEHLWQVRAQLEVLHSQAERIRERYQAELHSKAFLVYWTPPGILHVFQIERDLNFPYAQLEAFHVEFQRARDQERGGTRFSSASAWVSAERCPDAPEARGRDGARSLEQATSGHREPSA
jgi:hypothetical protein